MSKKSVLCATPRLLYEKKACYVRFAEKSSKSLQKTRLILEFSYKNFDGKKNSRFYKLPPTLAEG